MVSSIHCRSCVHCPTTSGSIADSNIRTTHSLRVPVRKGCRASPVKKMSRSCRSGPGFFQSSIGSGFGGGRVGGRVVVFVNMIAAVLQQAVKQSSEASRHEHSPRKGKDIVWCRRKKKAFD